MRKFLNFERMEEIIKANLAKAREVLDEFLADMGNLAAIEAAAGILTSSIS